MLDYTKITNDHLRELVMHSESINSQKEEEIFRLIDDISKLDYEKQSAMINALEAEQIEIQSAKLARGITPEMERKYIEQNQNKLNEINKEYNSAVLKHNESEAVKADSVEAENLLSQLNN